MPTANCQVNSDGPVADRRSATGHWQLLAWQGWKLRIPADWNPVKVEGDERQGLLLLADLERPRLGLRWRAVSSRMDGNTWAQRTMKGEVGALAAKQAQVFSPPGDGWQNGLLFSEPEPPGRDVFVAISTTSGRGVQMVYHARQRDRVFAEHVLPNLADTPADAARAWSIFDIACRSPAGWKLQWYRFHAGDLSLAFARGRSRVIVRQVGPASLALARQPLARWVAQQDKPTAKLYRAPAPPTEVELVVRSQPLGGLATTMHRRRRLFWAITTRSQHRLAVHDQARNRLVLVQGDDASIARAFLDAVGEIGLIDSSRQPSP